MVKTTSFWNKKENIEYFESKPADPIVVKYLSNVKDRTNLRALDLGCGGGRHTELLLKKGFKTFAIDINDSMIQSTANRIRKFKLENNLNIKIGGILDIPYENSFFDFVITTGVLHQAKNVNEYKKAIKELSRVCKNGAIIQLNIFTNKVMDPGYKYLNTEEYVVITREGLPMTLLPKDMFYTMMKEQNLILEEEYAEEIKQENTGPRSVLRSRFKKVVEQL